MTFFILPLWSARDLDIGAEGFSPRDDISRRLMTRAIWKRPCINLFITYFARAENMLLPFTRGQITCYCPRKMLLSRRQITRHKLYFYYTCKFGVISIICDKSIYHITKISLKIPKGVIRNHKGQTIQWPIYKRQPTIYKTLHRKLKIEHHEPN